MDKCPPAPKFWTRSTTFCYIFVKELCFYYHSELIKWLVKLYHRWLYTRLLSKTRSARGFATFGIETLGWRLILVRLCDLPRKPRAWAIRKKQGPVTYGTDRANEVNNMFIIWLFFLLFEVDLIRTCHSCLRKLNLQVQPWFCTLVDGQNWASPDVHVCLYGWCKLFLRELIKQTYCYVLTFQFIRVLTYTLLIFIIQHMCFVFFILFSIFRASFDHCYVWWHHTQTFI